MKEKIKNQQAKVLINFNWLSSVNKKDFLFFLIFVSFFSLALFTGKFIWFFLSLLSVIFWKIISGLSWLNFDYLLLSLFLLGYAGIFINRFFVILITFFLLILLFNKIFNLNFKKTNFFRLVTFYYLFFLFIFDALSTYFFLNLSFAFSISFFILGLIVFSLIYFLIKNRKFFPSGLFIVLVNTEIFWLISYLNLSVPFLSLILFLNYWLSLYYSYRFKVS